MRSAVRYTIVFLVQLVLIVSLAGPAIAAPPPRDDYASQVCGDGGFRQVADAWGDAFRNERQCLTYVRAGGTLLPVTNDPVMTVSFQSSGNGCTGTITLSGFAPGAEVPWGTRSWWSDGMDVWIQWPSWDAPNPIVIGTAGSGSQRANFASSQYDPNNGLSTYNEVFAGGLTWGPAKIEC